MRLRVLRLNWRIFFVALIFSLIIGVLGNVSVVLFWVFAPDAQAIAFMSLGLNVVSFFISPLLLFAVFYFIGGRIDLVFEFLSVVMSLFLGSLAGHLIGYFPLQLFYVIGYDSTFASQGFLFVNILWMLWYAFRIAVSAEFFVGFTALSIAYIMKKRSPQTDT